MQNNLSKDNVRLVPLDSANTLGLEDIYVHAVESELVSSKIASEGIWEKHETDLFLASLEAGDTVIDAGANIGYYSLLAAVKTGPQGRVYAFEPDATNFAILEKNCRHHQLDNIVTVPAALASESGDGKIYLNNSNFGDHQIYDDGNCRESRVVKKVRGADYLADKPGQLDFVKIDTQGAEYEVLQGLWPALMKNRSHLRMIVELWPKGLDRAGSSATAVVELLSGLGLPFFLIDHMSGGLLSISREQLDEWIESVDDDPGNEGFLNLFLGTNPLE